MFTGRMSLVLFAVALFLSMPGCPPKPAPPSAEEAVFTQDAAKVVRAVIAEHLEISPDEVDMQKPLSAQTVAADDLDAVEIVLELETRFNLSLPDEDIDAIAGKRDGGQWQRLKPAQLVELLVKARRASQGE
jgi:acyl carrier protein